MTAQAQHVDLLSRSTLFDATWYGMQYPDVALLGLQPAEHYLRYGALLLRDPSPGFSTRQYLEANPDVAAAGVNALVHYLEHGRNEGRSLAPHTATPNLYAEAVDVVVPVFNALEDVKKCLEAVRTRKDGFLVRCIVVNDGSNEETGDWLRRFSAEHADTFALIEHPKNLGYTKAVNTGLRASKAPYVITLNSDTIVTRGWLRGLVRCMQSDPTFGIVGPLSNAASWQNVPALYDASGAFAVNELPSGMTADDMAAVVASASRRAYPRMPFVNGFCFMIKRAVIDAVGYMDDENFPIGYGEENDYCVRAADAGFAMAIADDTYVFHAKSKSFGHERRKELSKHGSDTLKRKHTAAKFNALVQKVKETASLDRVRSLVNSAMERNRSQGEAIDISSMRVLFLLPVKGGGGGAHSVVQEVAEMRRLGIYANVGVRQEHLDDFLRLYGDVEDAQNVFVGFDAWTLEDVAGVYDVVVATIFSSVQLVKKIVENNPHIMPAYYAQDYEPLFFPHGSENWKTAHDSYGLVPHAVVFAKTHWIARQVLAGHGVHVHKVEPSIDHDVYKPRAKAQDGRVRVAAMIRPQTPRRGAERTMRVLSRLAKAHPNKVSFHLFGCAEDAPHFQTLVRDFEYHNHGTLKRPEVAELLGDADVFVDLSDYQAFGRTALEAMACGCAAVVPVHGGGDEYAIDGTNALVVDSLNEEECFERLTALIDRPAELRRMQSAGLETAARYSVHMAAVSELGMFARMLSRHRLLNPRPVRTRVFLFPASDAGGQATTDMGWSRVTLPFRSPLIRRQFEVMTKLPGQFPDPCGADIVVMQADGDDAPLDELARWHTAWRRAGGKLVVDVCDRVVQEDAVAPGTRAMWLVQNADVVIAGSEQVAQLLRERNIATVVIHDQLDGSMWRLGTARTHAEPPYGRTDDVVRIGYVGTPNDDADLQAVGQAIRQIEEEYGKRVLVEVIGVFQDSKPTFGKRIALPKKRDYPNFVNWLQERVHWDIGIVPPSSREVDNGRLRSRFLQHAALDMAIVCAERGALPDLARHQHTALMVSHNVKDWYAAIARLVCDSQLRSQLATNARNLVTERHTVESASELYVAALQLACEGAVRCAPREGVTA